MKARPNLVLAPGSGQSHSHRVRARESQREPERARESQREPEKAIDITIESHSKP